GRVVLGNAVARRRGDIDHPPRAMPPHRFEHGKGAVDIGAKISLRQLDRRDDIGARREMKHPVRAGADVVDAGAFGHIRPRLAHLEPTVAAMLLKIGAPSDRKVIEDAHAPALAEQSIDQVATNETRATGHYIEITQCPLRPIRTDYFRCYYRRLAENGDSTDD